MRIVEKANSGEKYGVSIAISITTHRSVPLWRVKINDTPHTSVQRLSKENDLC